MNSDNNQSGQSFEKYYIESRHTASALMEMEDTYGAHNYHPLPVVLSRGEGVHVWDVDGKR